MTLVGSWTSCVRRSNTVYSFINGKRFECSGVSVLKRDGISHSDPKEKSTTLNEQFGSAFTKEDLNAMPSMPGSHTHR